MRDALGLDLYGGGSSRHDHIYIIKDLSQRLLIAFYSHVEKYTWAAPFIPTAIRTHVRHQVKHYLFAECFIRNKFVSV